MSARECVLSLSSVLLALLLSLVNISPFSFCDRRGLFSHVSRNMIHYFALCACAADHRSLSESEYTESDYTDDEAGGMCVCACVRLIKQQ